MVGLRSRASGGSISAFVVALLSACPGPPLTGVDARSGPVADANAGSDRAPAADSARMDTAAVDAARDAGAGGDRSPGDLVAADQGARDLVAIDQGGRDLAAADADEPVDGGPQDGAGADAGCDAQCDAGPGSDRQIAVDAFWHVDASGIDSSGLAGVGQPCDDQNCVFGTTCLGDSVAGYFCRQNCTLGGSDCDPQTERCVWFTYNDGGVAPYGGCEPGVGYNEPCRWDGGSAFCAEVFLCVSPSGSFDYRCRARCLPGAIDAGCPVDSPQCWSIVNMDGGACMPRPG
ncbi:MAG: hypothetical protein JXR83_12195 [Deltaproteobacteria bacterium]|nr:hypothetical protein [Deltaproteobacteria bacterium]